MAAESHGSHYVLLTPGSQSLRRFLRLRYNVEQETFPEKDLAPLEIGRPD